MTSKERFELTINHKEPDRMVVDFGSTSVTGIHVLAVENLRRHYGLAEKPVRVTDPFQMLGEVDEELASVLGTDVTGAKGRKNSFGFYNHEPLKEYHTPWGQIVLVPEEFRTTTDAGGDTLMYPRVIQRQSLQAGCPVMVISLMPSSGSSHMMRKTSM
jgi:hypothetical protein